MVEFRVGDPNEAFSRGHKTQYCDLRGSSDPMSLGMGVHMFNYDSVALYMQITGSGTGWTIGSWNLGSIGPGGNQYRVINGFATKPKKSGEGDDSVTVTLNAYTDAGYSDLKWTYNRVVSLFFLDSTDPSWTTDELDNFDDGTVQGWNCFNSGFSGCGYATPPACLVSTNVFRSAPYSMLKFCNHTSSWNYETSGFFKTFTLPDKDEIYMIADVYLTHSGGGMSERGFFLEHGNTKPIPQTSDGVILNLVLENIPESAWRRLVARLPRNVTEELRVGFKCRYQGFTNNRFYMDDFKIISRDN